MKSEEIDAANKQSIEVSLYKGDTCVKAKVPATQQRIFWTGYAYGAGTLILVFVIHQIYKNRSKGEQ